MVTIEEQGLKARIIEGLRTSPAARIHPGSIYPHFLLVLPPVYAYKGNGYFADEDVFCGSEFLNEGFSWLLRFEAARIMRACSGLWEDSCKTAREAVAAQTRV